MFGPLSKWVAQIDRADRIPEYVRARLRDRLRGRPGPVVLALPEDMLDARERRRRTRCRSAPCSRIPAPAQLERPARPARARPSGRWRSSAARAGRRAPSQDLRVFLEANALPAGAAFRRQDALDNDSPSYVGDVGIGINPKLAARVREADLLLVVGPRLGEMTTSGYTLLESPTPRQTLVHVHPGAEELGRVYRPELPILAGMEQFAAAVRDAPGRAPLARVDGQARAPTTRRGSGTSRCPGDARPRRVHRAPPRARCPTRSSRTAPATSPSGCTASGAGTSYPTQLAPTSGAMGYGVPAAVAAKARRTRTARSSASPATATS